MEEYRLAISRGDLHQVQNYSELQTLVDQVLILDILNSDPHSQGRVVFGEKLVGLMLHANPPTVFGVRFKEDLSGKHLIASERYRRLNYSPEQLALTPDNFAQRNIRSIFDSNREFLTSYHLKGVIDTQD